METLEVLKQYGPWGVVLAIWAYLLLKGEFVFRFPTRRK